MSLGGTGMLPRVLTTNGNQGLARRAPALIAAGFGAAVVSLVGVFSWLYAHALVGTDLGVYWEVAGRLWRDGRLALGDNYWDHKPPAAYVALAPFHAIHVDGAEFAGLRVGTALIYATGLVAALAAGRDRAANSRTGNAALGAGVLLCTALVYFPFIDGAANGVLLVAAVCCEFTGLMLLVRRAGGAVGALAAGAAIASAPMCRPTSICAGVVLAAMTAMVVVRAAVRGAGGAGGARGADGVGRADERFVLIAFAAAALTSAGWIALIVALGTPIGTFVEVVGGFNAEYGAYFRGITSIGDFVLQQRLAFWVMVAALGALMASLVWIWQRPHASADAGPDAAPKRGVVVVAAWAALSIAVAIVSRKIQSFYTLQFAMPAVLGAAWAAGRVPNACFRAGVAAAATICAGVVSVSTWQQAAPVARASSLASDARRQTGAIVDVLAAYAARAQGGAGKNDRPARVWICGNRAPLFTQARLRGVRPYDWTVYDTALYAIDSAAFDAWLARFEADPPEFVVRVSNGQHAPWLPRELTDDRSRRINAVLGAAFVEVSVPSAPEPSWPYNFQYATLVRADIAAMPASGGGTTK